MPTPRFFQDNFSSFGPVLMFLGVLERHFQCAHDAFGPKWNFCFSKKLEMFFGPSQKKLPPFSIKKWKSFFEKLWNCRTYHQVGHWVGTFGKKYNCAKRPLRPCAQSKLDVLRVCVRPKKTWFFSTVFRGWTHAREQALFETWKLLDFTRSRKKRSQVSH